MPRHGPLIRFSPNARYPDTAVQVLHERFAALRIYSARVEQLASGCHWGEGPVWFGDHHCPLWSDIPNNRIQRWDDANGQVTTFRSPSQHANGLDGKRLNSPNDIVCQRTGPGAEAVWFTDPTCGIQGWWQGEPAAPELPHGVYRIDTATGRLDCVLDDLDSPKGLAFSPDESVLYAIECRATPIMAASHSLYALTVNVQGAV
jgi:gluconolactonase